MFNYSIGYVFVMDHIEGISINVVVLFKKKFCKAVQLHVGIPLYLCKLEKQLEKTPLLTANL